MFVLSFVKAKKKERKKEGKGKGGEKEEMEETKHIHTQSLQGNISKTSRCKPQER